jgi:hypothetical protein
MKGGLFVLAKISLQFFSENNLQKKAENIESFE